MFLSKYLTKGSFSTTKIFFGRKSQKLIIEGVSDVAKATQVTLGPGGKNAVIDYELGAPKITKDGVTVAKSINFSNRTKEIGAFLIRRASHNTNTFAGDGTTTSTILTNSIVSEAMKLSHDINPIELKRGIDKGRKVISDFLDEITHKIEESKMLRNIARVASNYDENISDIVTEALWKSGTDGSIHIEPGTGFLSTLTFTQGVSINRGYASEEFLKNKRESKIEALNPLILISNQEITATKQIINALEKAKTVKQPLFIIAKDISNEVISNLIYNHQKNIVENYAITVPGMGDFTREILEDFGCITGAKVFDENAPNEILNLKMEDLGRAAKFICSQLETMIIGAGGKEDAKRKRIEAIDSQIHFSKGKSSTANLEILRDRRSRLAGKMAVIQCGGNTEVEMYEVRDKIIDALNSAKFAMIGGILPGGGSALLHASKLLGFVEGDNEEQNYGIQILQRSLKKPAQILFDNAGKNGRFIVEKVLEFNDHQMGYNLLTNNFENMLSAGICDCHHVVKTALEDAVSIATMILSTNVVIAKEKKYTPTPLSAYRKEIF